jgi:class 3 adenylate cyclase/tetratricopeptide (TPR) repeat protein
MPQSGTITLLFTSLAGSSDQLNEQDDEAAEQLFRSHHKVLSEAIQSSNGEELEWIGDGVLVAFSSAADAIRCAITMQQTACRPVHGARLEMRIGVHLGEVFHREGGYFGTPVVVARRLCDQAESGQILCSRLIADILSKRQSLGFRDLGELKLKGLADPLGVSEVIYDRNDPVALLNRTPFVGRAAQLKRLTAKLDEVAQDRGSIVMLRGEPGIGKTRTLEEFADLARERGIMALGGLCYDGEWQPPYGPFAEAIREYAQQASPSELAETLGRRVAVLARIVPALRATDDIAEEPVSVEKDEERFRLFDAMAQTLIAISRRTPLLLMLDDLHWADRGTIAMLNHISHSVASNPILLVGAYRDTDVNRVHPLSGALAAINRLRGSETIALKGLQSEELSSMLELIGEQAPPPALVKALGDATEGNPLFIREVLLHLQEEGKILHEGAGWNPKLDIEQLGIPEGVRHVIDRRLARLSKEANQLLSVAAAFNGAFSFDVAAGASGLSEQAALAAVDEAMEAQLIRAGSNSDTYDFTHALIRHTLYSGLNPSRRIRMHRTIAEEMERAWGEKTAQHAAEVAFHFWRAAAIGGANRGVDYAIAAAENAATAYAHDDVVGFMRIALELLPPNDPRRPRLLARLSLALTWTLNSDEALATAREAVPMIERSEGPAACADYCEQVARAMFNAGLTAPAWALAKEGLHHIGERRDVVWASLAEIDINRREGEDSSNPGIMLDTPESRALCEVLKSVPREELRDRNMELIHLSREEILSDPEQHPRQLMMAGDLVRAVALWQQEAAASEQRGALARALRAWAMVARCHNVLGAFIEARAALDRAAALLARIGRPSFGLIALQAARVEMRFASNDHWPELIMEIATDFDLPQPELSLVFKARALGPEGSWVVSVSRAYLACVYAHLNQRELALQQLELLPPALARGAQWSANYSPTACSAAATIWLLNRQDHLELIDRSLREKVVGPDLNFTMSDGRLALARVCALQSKYDEASEWFERARRSFDTRGVRTLRALTDYDEGLMYFRRGSNSDTATGRHLAEVALEQFQNLGMTGWAAHATNMVQLH